jgi:predicted nucleotidyltransferase
MQEANDEALLNRLVRIIGGVVGVRAIVLGGSRARGEASPNSDYDVGLYYEPAAPIDIGRLAKAVTRLPGPATSSVTAIGEWGPWINGGAWLTVEGKRADLLYRDLERVRSVIARARAGQIECVYQPGHPHAFVSSIYMGEVALCRVLWDPDDVMVQLKRECDPYPDALAQALIQRFFWEARFALENAAHGRAGADPAYVAGCKFRSVACLCQTLFALNRTYLLNEKGAVAAIERLPRRPPNFATRVRQSLAGDSSGFQALRNLVDETSALLG